MFARLFVTVMVLGGLLVLFVYLSQPGTATKSVHPVELAKP